MNTELKKKYINDHVVSVSYLCNVFNIKPEISLKSLPEMCIEILQYFVLVLYGLNDYFHHLRTVTVAMLRVIHCGEKKRIQTDNRLMNLK